MLHPMNVELHSRTELHSSVELHNEVETHSNLEISVHERDAKLPERDVHSDLEVERPIKKPNLNQDCLNMSRDIILLHTSLEIKMLDQ